MATPGEVTSQKNSQVFKRISLVKGKPSSKRGVRGEATFFLRDKIIEMDTIVVSQRCECLSAAPVMDKLIQFGSL